MSNEAPIVTVEIDPQVKAAQTGIETRISPLEKRFTAIVIKDDADFEKLDADVKMVKGLIKENAEIFDPVVDKHYRPYVFWRDIRTAIKNRLESLETAGKKALIAYANEKKEKAEAAQRAAQAATDEAARKEAEKLEKKAERAEAKGDVGKAQELRDAAQTVHVPTPVVQEQAAPQIKGSSIRDNWKGECVDLMKLVKAVAEGRASINLISANNVAINQQAKATKNTFAIDGIRFYNDPSYSASTK